MSADELLIEALRLSSVVRVALLPDALGELRAAALWYDEREPGLGDRLIDRLA